MSQNSIKTLGLVALYSDTRIAHTVEALVAYAKTRGLTIKLLDHDNTHEALTHLESLDAQHFADACDVILAVGGDGTLLHASHLVAHGHVPIIGIHRGQLGFLTDVDPLQLDASLDALLGGERIEEQRMMMSAKLVHENQCETGLALNDIVVKRIDSARMLEFDIYVNDQYFNTQAGDGVIIATPTGSTAYALSSGGPILDTALNTMVIVPVCPHTLSERPVVISADSKISVQLRFRPGTEAGVSVDGKRIGLLTHDGAHLEITRSPHALTLWHPTDYNLFATLREKLAWGQRRPQPPA